MGANGSADDIEEKRRERMRAADEILAERKYDGPMPWKQKDPIVHDSSQSESYPTISKLLNEYKNDPLISSVLEGQPNKPELEIRLRRALWGGPLGDRVITRWKTGGKHIERITVGPDGKRTVEIEPFVDLTYPVQADLGEIALRPRHSEGELPPETRYGQPVMLFSATYRGAPLGELGLYRDGSRKGNYKLILEPEDLDAWHEYAEGSRERWKKSGLSLDEFLKKEKEVKSQHYSPRKKATLRIE